MKQADKFLIAIVVAIILLVVAAFALVLLRPPPQYRQDKTAEAAVHNYLLALQQGDYERALNLISEDVPHRPQDAAEMEFDVKQNEWQFDRYGNPSLIIVSSRVSGDAATVTLKETRSNSPILGDIDSQEITMRLQQEDGGWKLLDGQAYWAFDWTGEQTRRIDR